MAVIDTAPVIAERRMKAMGSEAHVIVVGSTTEVFGAARDAARRITELEQRWSRFRCESEVSRLNTGQGEAIGVSDDTVRLVAELGAAWRRSGGAFDPTVGRALAASGYDRPFADMDPDVPVRQRSLAAPTTTLGDIDIDIDTDAGRVRLPVGVELDPGGLGKGLAADIAVAELLARTGVEGALVSMGGDLRCAGRGPHGSGWAIEVGEPVAGVREEVLMLDRGAVATSTPARRRWRTGDGWAHHLIDARTRRATVDPPAAVTVIADRATDAEWIATAIASGARELLFRLSGDFAVVLTEADGRRLEHGPIEEFRP